MQGLFYTIATDNKRVTIATNGRVYGKACLAVEDIHPFSRVTGIGAAVINCYLTIATRPVHSLEGFPEYLLVYLDPAYMAEMIATAMNATTYHRRGLIAESWGKDLQFDIVSVAPTLKEVQDDLEKIKTDAWVYDDYSKKKDIH